MINILFYIIFLIVSLSLTFLLNCVFHVDTVSACLLYVFISFVFEVAIDAILATFIRHVLPYKVVDFLVIKSSKREKKVYEFFGIKHWKDNIPDLGQFAGFKKSRLVEPTNSEYLERFILESKYGEIVHFTSSLASFTLLFLGFIKPQFLLTIFLPCSFINLFLNLLPALVQRYVRPRLEILYKRSLRS